MAPSMTPRQQLVACRDCDLINTINPHAYGERFQCTRCGSLLRHNKINSIERSLALVTAGLILFLVACSYPILSLKVVGAATSNTLITGVIDLYHYGLKDCSLMVFFMTILIPFVKFAMLFYILTSLRWNLYLPKRLLIFRVYHIIDTWGMLEVYMLAIIVAMVKLTDFATVSIGIGLHAFIACMVISFSISATLDPHLIWERLEANP